MRGRPFFLRAPHALRAVLASTAGLGALASFATVGSSCSNATNASADGTPMLTLAPTIIGPKGLIDEIAVFGLSVYAAGADGGVTCDPTTGNLGGAYGLEGPAYGPFYNATDSSSVCASTYSRCIVAPKVVQSTVPYTFAVSGFTGSDLGTPIALGCVTTTITPTTNDAPVSLDIKMVAIPSCGDGIVQPTETCDDGQANGTSGDACSAQCQTSEQLLSAGSGTKGGSLTVNGGPGDKRDPYFLWPAGGNFFAFFSDNSTNTAASEQISMRILDKAFAPQTSLGAVVGADSIFVPDELPSEESSFPPPAVADDHKQPVAVQSGGFTYVVFADDSSGNFQVVLRAFDGSLNAQQSSPCPVGDSSAGESGNQTAPTVAVSQTSSGADIFYIAWQDDSGQIYGRTYTPNKSGACGTLGIQEQVSSGSSSSHVSLAGNILDQSGAALGWVAAWQSGSDVAIREIKLNSELIGQVALETSGHIASTPVVASFSGGFAVAWADKVNSDANNTIYARRFKNGAFPVEGATQVSQASDGNEITPFIAASSAVSGSYVITWADPGSASDAQVRARLLNGTSGSLGDATGYLENTIDGTTNEFVVSVGTGRVRVNPTVVVGGSVYMAFGWADDSAASGAYSPGIIGRRFPLPTQ
jgi:cysteine-rich repeat protein